MAEDVNLKNQIKEEILELKEIDIAILEAYNEMPKDFKENIKFTDYYLFHRERLQKRADRNELQEELNSLPEPLEKPREIIPEEQLCKSCKKEKKVWDDKDYCSKCRDLFREEAQSKLVQIKEILLKDPHFVKLTNETAAIAYVKEKFAAEQNKNKFITLTSIAKQAYQLKKINMGK
ncbi:MAG: hypothetical protein PHO02_02340 [Candidatus Nanoarchaeia archaeon]|nr:hypothetical protein [Candidatus Nanoarchaeia archaeon]